MRTQFEIHSTLKLPDGTIVLTGSFDGPRLARGQRGLAATPSGDVRVEIIGSGGLDRDLIKPNMDSVLVRVLEGDHESLKGATLNFD